MDRVVINSGKFVTDSEMRRMLSKGVVHFTFRKKDGSLRTAKGTTSFDAMIESGLSMDKYPAGIGEPRKRFGQVPFYDIEADGWRSYSEGSLIEVFE